MLRNKFYDSLKKILFAFVAMMFVAPAFSANLPAGYTELEYLESDGSQYIDTRVSGFNTGTWEVYAKWMITTQTQTNTYPNVFSVYNGEDYNSYRVINKLQDSTSYYVSGNSKAGGGSILVSNIAINQIHEATARNGSVTIDGVVYDTSAQGSTLPASSTMGIFARSDGAGKIQARIYSAWATKNGVLQYNLVPAKYVSGNTTTYGMYDLKNERFLTNSGTGTFTAGPIVCPNGGTLITYTTANGTTTWTGTPTPTTPITFVDYTQGELKLRAVGNWADSYDANTGKITRKIGTLILKGNEGFTVGTPLSGMFNLNGVTALSYPDDRRVYSTHFKTSTVLPNASAVDRNGYIERSSDGKIGIGYMPANNDIDAFKSWLAEQYSAGTPVIIYYPLPTETEEIWPAEQCIAGNLIKIATTKYNEEAFANLVTTLNSAITKVTNIVDTTVAQASSIGTLATTKQDRPADGDCPAGRKCLLVTGTDGKPHWYLIQE